MSDCQRLKRFVLRQNSKFDKHIVSKSSIWKKYDDNKFQASPNDIDAAGTRNAAIISQQAQQVLVSKHLDRSESDNAHFRFHSQILP